MDLRGSKNCAPADRDFPAIVLKTDLHFAPLERGVF
jgi:hypothetical protein